MLHLGIPALQKPILLCEALTCPSASLDYNYETLELVGDAYLKFAVSADVFLFSLKDEGQMTISRRDRISNENLQKIAKPLLESYAFSSSVTSREILHPPSLLPLVNSRTSADWRLQFQFPTESVFCARNYTATPGGGFPHKSGRKLLPKALADVTEAIIGALAKNGTEYACLLLNRVGLISTECLELLSQERPFSSVPYISSRTGILFFMLAISTSPSFN